MSGGNLNDEYDEWHHDEGEEEFLYEDPDGLTDIIVDACNFLHQCVEDREYRAGFEMAEMLVGLCITVEGEYQDYTDEPIGIDEHFTKT